MSVCTVLVIEGRLRGEEVNRPERQTFEEYLRKDARVPIGGGLYGPFSFDGREPLLVIVRTIDFILGSVSDANSGAQVNAASDAIGRVLSSPLADAELSLAGGAQFGKTILELNLAAYLTGCRFRNFGLYLPDDDLVEGIVDSKFRPDVVDQVGWFARMVQVGKALNKSGKAVNRKGAFLVTDGRRKAMGMIRGLGKVPTTFSMDAAAMDEVDDIVPRMMKFVRGRLAASDLRLLLKIGTQRIHSRGMNKAWKDGSQGVFLFKCPKCGRMHCAEEEFPQIVRLRKAESGKAEIGKLGSGKRATTGAPFPLSRFPPSAFSPKLTWSGDFKVDGKGNDHTRFAHSPLNQYYLGCVSCGAKLDRSKCIVEHRQPALLKQRKWSYRISQLAIGAIDLTQIVGRFQAAVADPEEMIVFRCDVLGLPQSTSQALTPAMLDRARAVTVFDLAPRVGEGNSAYGGLDMGDRCWLYAREVLADGQRRLLAAERMSAGDVVARTLAAFEQLGLSALFIDERPLVNEARTIALALNGLQGFENWPRITNVNDSYITLPGGLTWDGRNSRWLNLKCALVRFTKTKLGAGIEQTIVFFDEGGQTKFVPCIACNRFETIDRAVREFLTPAEGVVEIIGSQESSARARDIPAMLLPRMTPGHPPILDVVEAHLIAGSERVRETDGTLGDYVDGCENHFLLANAYSALAALVCGPGRHASSAPIVTFDHTRRSRILAERANRSVEG